MTKPATTATSTKSQSMPLSLLGHSPVNALLLAPHAVLIVPMAVINQNPETGFILRLLALAMAGATLVETAALLIWRRKSWRKGQIHTRPDHPQIFLTVRLVAIASMIADVAGTMAGRGTFVTLVAGEVAAPPVASASALVAGWEYVAFALLLSSFLSGRPSWSLLPLDAGAHRSAGLPGVPQGDIRTAHRLPDVRPRGGLILGAIRFRYVVVAMALLFLACPASG